MKKIKISKFSKKLPQKLKTVPEPIKQMIKQRIRPRPWECLNIKQAFVWFDDDFDGCFEFCEAVYCDMENKKQAY